MNNILICEICKEPFNLDKKKPIFLPCLHTFCKMCLLEIFKKNSYIKCPADNKKHFQSIDFYPPNSTFLRQINSNELDRKVKIIKTEKAKTKINEDLDRSNNKLDRKNHSSSKNNLISLEEEINNAFDPDSLKICNELSFFVVDDDLDISFEYAEEEVVEKEKVSQEKEIVNESVVKKEGEWFNQFDSEQKVNQDHVIFSYFNVMKGIINCYEKVKSAKKPFNAMSIDILDDKVIISEQKESNLIIAKIVKTLLIFFVIIINYYVIKNELFLRIFAFVALSNDTKKSLVSQSTHNLSLCLKRWLAYFTIIILDELISGMFSGLNLIWKCFLVIYMLIITGHVTGLNIIVSKIVVFLENLRLLI